MSDRKPQARLDAKTARKLLAEERAGATARISSLQRHLSSIREVSTWTGTDDEHDPEGATIAYERAQVQGLLADARRDLEALDRAAARLDDGTYGLCERCGSPIAPERLEALPATTTCIACATHRR
ncbi:TraR/DksA family transcriptional regulator [Saccharopolyspora erythraea NRRL 2338]|uniref:Possible suppressor protein DnaK n=2 Tax=Saccharopolyspora erythraea TaxID=1836 RepID=A4F8B9_SACEN|nr:TraR/DksA C4-type zinc finger protein [Saccharopolyspora erythraea]EQD85327.1 suppressor protein DnaK [Saccharopolyspora erythraea D]PFG94088.1 TraR/DksA family transcriptional regulator [Saccharopolyspora erythraea NRRL 2338]QRK90883.1 TraR/DksA C4-type zinc finger protein [Saccharopolyspora erythraea]CAM00294.1 possible suppressor protein DnaK [Saccharopolyspora erythraea NRRL 2338]